MLLLALPAFAIGPSDRGDVPVTEFQADPEAVPAYYGEWIELYDASGTTLDLNGVDIVLDSGDTEGHSDDDGDADADADADDPWGCDTSTGAGLLPLTLSMSALRRRR